MEDTIQAISLPEDESKDKSTLYIVDLTHQRSISNADQTTTPNLTELPIKDTEQLPTPSRTVSPDLPESNATPGGLQDDILNTIEPIPTQPSSPELFNRAINTALRANEISAKPSADLILPEGLK